MMNDFAKVLTGSRWLMAPKNFRAMVERCAVATPEAITAAAAAFAQRPQTATMVGDVAVINCCGPITYRNSYFSMWYGSSTIEGMQAQFRQALIDPAVRAIVFRVDTPGGTVEMVPEFADELFAARGQKPIHAAADTMMCSAGYWVFSQTDMIYAPRSSGAIGSVGAYLQHEEISGLLEKMGVKVTLISYGENKTEANEYEPLSETAEAYLQAEVNEVGVEFDTYVARGRGITRAVVSETFGQGRVFSGAKALKLGMVDKLATFDQVLAKLTATKRRTGVQAAAVTATDGLGNAAVVVGGTLTGADGAIRELTTDEVAAMNGTPTTTSAAEVLAVEPCERCGRSATCNCPGGCAPGCDTCADGCPCKEPAEDEAASARAAADRDAVNIAIALSGE